MGIHASQSEEAAERLKKQKTTSTITSFLISVAVIGVITAILALLTIFIPSKEIETIITYKATVADQDISNKPTIQKMQRQVPTPPAAASSAVSNVITTTAPTTVSVPDTNDFVSVESADFGSSADFGFGMGEVGEEATFTLFGSKANTGISGHIYDLKKSPDGKQSDIYNKIGDIPKNKYTAAYLRTEDASKLVKSKYSQSSLKKYYRSAEMLNFTFLVVDKASADTGPKAFNAEKDIKPLSWVAVYEGAFAEDAKDAFRFWGVFDDILIVYINNKIVFDGSWGKGFSSDYNKMQTASMSHGISGLREKSKMSEYITPKAGDKIRIVVGEIPGGSLGGGLFVEEKKNEGKNLKPIPFVTVPVEGEVKSILRDKGVDLDLRDVPVYNFKN